MTNESAREDGVIDSITYGQYVSITKSCFADDFYHSVDLNPAHTVNVGSNPNNFWDHPYILFYTISTLNFLPWEDPPISDTYHTDLDTINTANLDEK